jgi:hypothetical protein
MIKKKRTLLQAYLEKTFKPQELPQNEGFETEINRTLEDLLQLMKPIKFFTPKEIKTIIQDLNPRKESRYDLITGKI